MADLRVFVIVTLSFIGTLTIAWIPNILNGRPSGGMLNPPDVPEGVKLPKPQFYEFQLVDHFDGSDFRYWKQRYYLNEDFHRPGGPIFLMLGGESAINPVWMVEGTWIHYAKMYGAFCVMLEHRYYGESHPVPDLSSDNMKYLSSRQALADAANFIADLRKWVKYGIQNSTLIVFGGGYAGSLAAWFRSKYPYMVDGAVASSAPIVAEMDFQEYYVQVGAALDTTGPRCRAEVDNATKTMYDWWGQPEKREEMQLIFKLCDKINHNALLDLTVFFYNLAVNFANVVQYNKVNRTMEGEIDTNITVNTLCDIMTDESRGNNIQRYADVNSLILKTYSQQCLNLRYTKLAESLNHTAWHSISADGQTNTHRLPVSNYTHRLTLWHTERPNMYKILARLRGSGLKTISDGRQWLYQQCSEFGWFQSSWSKQPFGYWFTFPWNFTTDQCIDVFQRIFGGSQVQLRVDETNRYYGGRSLPISNVVFVNGNLDPWKPSGISKDLSPEATAINIDGTSHCADMYPPSDTDPPELTQARAQIGILIGKWIQRPTK